MNRREFIAIMGGTVGASLVAPAALSTTPGPKRFVFVVEGNGIDLLV